MSVAMAYIVSIEIIVRGLRNQELNQPVQNFTHKVFQQVQVQNVAHVWKAFSDTPKTSNNWKLWSYYCLVDN
eukprot:TRINITY_DN3934_c0_g1_i1.p2 TRINITY_DN3934_c0_g1~~TRINITY_DN3934_c0_g1_i1.p2  ORF type:complete len:72 (+),score=6.38 TRINITY_DN3934_c0_g1_i1:728-943(+)